MSLICWVLGLAPAQIKALRATPSLASDVAMVAVLDEMTKTMPPEKRQAFQQRMSEARARLAPIGPLEQALSIEKSWHMLHYLFTGHVDASDAPGNALLTGQAVGENLGFGPPRLQDELRTREFGVPGEGGRGAAAGARELSGDDTPQGVFDAWRAGLARAA